MSRRLHIAMVVEQRYLAQAQPVGMSAALKAAGHDVTLINPEVYEAGEGLGEERFDLVVARGRSWPLLSLLSWAEAWGKPTLNARSAIGAVHNKAEMALRLADEKVPIPRTFVGRVADVAKQLPARCYPLVLKPIFGDNARGLRIVRTPAELAELDAPGEIALVQHYLPNDGYDLKLYGIGDDVWAVRKRSPLAGSSEADSGAELLPLTPQLEELARRCGRLFGLQLFGVDCIQTPREPVVIEVNEFPNYSGVPDADQALAAYAADYATGRCRENRNVHA